MKCSMDTKRFNEDGTLESKCSYIIIPKSYAINGKFRYIQHIYIIMATNLNLANNSPRAGWKRGMPYL